MKKILYIAITLFLIFAAYVIGWNENLDKSESKIIPLENKKIILNTDLLWNLIQTWRKENNLPVYIKSDNLCTIANDRVLDGFDFHEGAERKYNNWPYHIAENINIVYEISCKGAEYDTLDMWLYSASHAATLKKPYKYSCLATKDNYAVQIFSNF
jgi:hypothetical protein